MCTHYKQNIYNMYLKIPPGGAARPGPALPDCARPALGLRLRASWYLYISCVYVLDIFCIYLYTVVCM